MGIFPHLLTTTTIEMSARMRTWWLWGAIAGAIVAWECRLGTVAACGMCVCVFHACVL